MWDALTQNLDEYGAKVEAAAKHVDDLIKEYNEVESRVDAVINSLIEFSSDIEKTNAGLALQKNLIAELQANYGDLGISINATTGEIQGLYEGIVKLQRIRKQQKRQLYEQKAKRAHEKTMFQQTKANNANADKEDLTDWKGHAVPLIFGGLGGAVSRYYGRKIRRDTFSRPTNTPITTERIKSRD